jgi:hypothetical protein
MKRKELLVDQKNMYALTIDENENYYIEVVCGGFAMENLIIQLSDEEMKEYESKGKSFLDDLAWRICKNKSKYEDRFIF